MRRLILIIILILLVISGLYLVTHKNKTPAKANSVVAQESFGNLLKAKDYSASYKILSDAYKKQMPEDSWKTFVQNGGTYTKLKVTSTAAVENPDATYSLNTNPQKVIYDAETSTAKYDILVVFVTENGQQKVDELQRYIK